MTATEPEEPFEEMVTPTGEETYDDPLETAPEAVYAQDTAQDDTDVAESPENADSETRYGEESEEKRGDETPTVDADHSERPL